MPFIVVLAGRIAVESWRHGSQKKTGMASDDLQQTQDQQQKKSLIVSMMADTTRLRRLSMYDMFALEQGDAIIL